MRGDAHDGAGPVVHEDVVRYPDGNLFTIERIDGVASGRHAVLFDLADVADFFGFALLGNELIDLGAQIGVRRREISDDGMLGRKLH